MLEWSHILHDLDLGCGFCSQRANNRIQDPSHVECVPTPAYINFGMHETGTLFV